MAPKTVLIVAYYYPPLGAIGSMRPQKLARYLPEFGWQPIVLTVDATQSRAATVDLSLDTGEAQGVRIVRTSAFDPAQWLGGSSASNAEKANAAPTSAVPNLAMPSQPSAKARARRALQRFVKSWLYVPDAQNGWYAPAVRGGLELLKTQPVDAIFSTSFPVTAHYVGSRLKRACGAPWVADFRDLWTENHDAEFYASPRRKKLDQILEKRLLSRSDAIVTVSNTWAATLKSIVPAGRVEVIRNGFDAADYVGLKRTPPTNWTLSFVGTYYGFYDLSPLFEVWRRLLESGRMERGRVCFQVVGQRHPLLVKELARFGLEDITEFSGYVAHREALQRMMNSSVLMLMLGREGSNPGHILAKLFEYLGARRPILGILPPEFESAQIIRDAQAGWTVEPGDLPGIERCLLESYDAFRAGGDDSPAATDISVYERRGTAQTLAKLLDDLSAQRTKQFT